jgi:REP element-mobilizing transposase RayT
MTNHIHLLASPGTAESGPKTMQSVGRRYVQYFNFRYTRTGTLQSATQIAQGECTAAYRSLDCRH